MAFVWFLTISPPSRSISVLSGCYSSGGDLNSSPTSSPRSPRLVWGETLSCSWTVISSWKSLLVLVTLAVFDSILSISLRRKMNALFKSTLFTDDGDCGNAAVMVSTSYATLDKQWNFELRIPSVTVTADLVTFMKIFNEKHHFLCNANSLWRQPQALSTILRNQSFSEPVWDNAGISLSLLGPSDMPNKFMLQG